ncbi:MAG: Asp-tRNA(Asn)/Glu-tRNA(Gln) amidotransferase subunit GatB [Nitrospinae bacterium]|nr:Asp-tRNA(Asn)/Glu-tRNA(Gln) amidotransferase subunit GatB [Nitrospinota bacterium]
MKYEPVIGLEVHVQLNTASKIFCGCSTRFGDEPNANTCPICVGMPGVLPVLNREVVEKAVRAAVATNCEVAPYSRWARKNYFYPDLPKGYQISMYELPLAVGGRLEVVVDGKPKTLRIHRIHMEEDAGKLVHGENLGDPAHSYVDLNRAGVPLIEIVSEADMRSSAEAKAYMEKLKSILEYLEVSDCNMEEGSMRVDVNISVRPAGQEKFGTRAEVKNMNSFRNMQKAIEYEMARQSELLDEGGRVVQESRLWDANRNVTVSMRSKEEAHDYRYFPEPDLVPLLVGAEWVERAKKSLPELPDAKRQRFVSSYSIPLYDAEVLTADKPVADYFERTVQAGADPKTASNWIMTEILRVLKERGSELGRPPISPEMLAELLKMIRDGVISGKMAKDVFAEMEATGKNPADVVREKGLVQISDESAIEKSIDEILAANPEQVAGYKGGKTKLMGFFVGEVMKATKGKANPAVVNKILSKKLSS